MDSLRGTANTFFRLMLIGGETLICNLNKRCDDDYDL